MFHWPKSSHIALRSISRENNLCAQEEKVMCWIHNTVSATVQILANKICFILLLINQTISHLPPTQRKESNAPPLSILNWKGEE